MKRKTLKILAVFLSAALISLFFQKGDCGAPECEIDYESVIEFTEKYSADSQHQDLLQTECCCSDPDTCTSNLKNRDMQIYVYSVNRIITDSKDKTGSGYVDSVYSYNPPETSAYYYLRNHRCFHTRIYLVNCSFLC